MDFTLTTRLEKIGMENMLIVDIVATEPVVMGPNMPLGLKDDYDSWGIDGTCDPNGQHEYSTSISLGPVDCSSPIPAGASVTVNINKNGGGSTKTEKDQYSGSSICT